MRVDKWIWAVRTVKTRTLAGLLCKGGKVLINGEKAKSSKQIKLGDVVEVSQKKIYKKYRVTGFLEKRTSATIAAQNYEDLTPPPENDFDRTVSGEDYLKKTKNKDGRRTKKEYRTIRQVRWDD